MDNSFDVRGFDYVKNAELGRIKQRRSAAGLPEGDPSSDTVGLALSGGGIRSATFNLGLLQAMNYYKFLPKVDYLSTVSGGGYVGSSLTWFMSRLGQDFPFLTTCKDQAAARVLRWLR
ncbi:MAG: patatin-like phospholipase family protein, partial [Gammaproteobacteria bacterium]